MLREAWCAATSADPERWTPDNPAWGQCAVSALIIQDLLGGELRRCLVDGESHYFNRIEDGTTVDVTGLQFPRCASWREMDGVRDRVDVLSYPATAVRYRILWGRLLALLVVAS